MNKWTEQQEKAIKTKGKNLLLSAAAGSGKTTVLVEKMTRLVLEDKVGVDRLLVVTFTKAAAEEMKQRIHEKLTEELANAVETRRQEITNQINALPFASISTIHSFCLQMIQKYYHVIGLDPATKVGNETALAIMRQKALEEVMEEEYEKEEESFLALMEMFSNQRKDDRFREIILKIREFSSNHPYPEEWLGSAVANFEMDEAAFNKSLFYKEVKQHARTNATFALQLLGEALKETESFSNPEPPQSLLKQEAFAVESVLNGLEEGMGAFVRALKDCSFDTWRTNKEDKPFAQEAKEKRDSAKKVINQLKDDYAYEQMEVLFENLREMKPHMDYLTKIVMRYQEVYDEAKREKGIMDFNDLEHFALQILEDEEAREELKEQYQYVFIDEYQDSNQIQDTIASKIKREDNLFLVGDVKQSIYLFRHSDPTLFIGKSREYERETEKSEVQVLNQNFRSSKNVIDTVNRVFEQTMSKYVGEIDYNDQEKLYQGVCYEEDDGRKVQLFLLQQDGQEENEAQEMEKSEIEARFVAGKIKELIGTRRYDPREGAYKPIEYKDIVLLFRSVKKTAPIYQQVFREEGIPVYAETGGGYFDTLEIALILDFLRVIDNAYQDTPLLAVLRSPIFGFTTEELVEIRTAQSENSIYETLKTYSETEGNDLAKKAGRTIAFIRERKEEARYTPIDQFLWKAYMDTNYYHYIGGLPGGMQRQANLRVLVDRAKEFSKSTLKGLFHFILFVEELKETKSDLSSAKVLGAMDNVVRVMSIHKSKGLEFPLVFIGNIEKRFNTQDENQSVILHKELGICPDYVNLEKRRMLSTILKRVAKTKIRLETLSEEMRILYVAMSRSKNQLYLVGTYKEKEKDKLLEKWGPSSTPYRSSVSKSYLDWIMSAMPIRYRPQEEKIFEEDCADGWFVDARQQSEKEEAQQTGKEDFFREMEKIRKEEQISERIQQIMDWTYERKDRAKIPEKIAVSQIGKFQNEKGAFRINQEYHIPEFDKKESPLTAAEKGTINHEVLARIELNKLREAADLSREVALQVKELVGRGHIEDEHQSHINKEAIAAFYESAIGRRLLKSEKVYREKPFTLRSDLEDIIGESGSKEGILIQGIIDCFFYEGDEVVLVDYKSDYYQNEQMQKSLVEGYAKQIQLYKKAIETITGKRVKESYIYFLYGNHAYPVDLS
ncbi:MAG TPA: helicase-exonuclease AddAB subunit AddA [Eubacteriaceae bacterium]|nr:helicase-exonuclease AddAB subunit AddA [Eubacteriaceae bacterium]